jgi:hypothetical protein
MVFNQIAGKLVSRRNFYIIVKRQSSSAKGVDVETQTWPIPFCWSPITTRNSEQYTTFHLEIIYEI